MWHIRYTTQTRYTICDIALYYSKKHIQLYNEYFKYNPHTIELQIPAGGTPLDDF